MFGNLNYYQHLKYSWIACDRIINIEVIQETLLRVTVAKSLPEVCNTSTSALDCRFRAYCFFIHFADLFKQTYSEQIKQNAVHSKLSFIVGKIGETTKEFSVCYLSIY